MTGDRPFLGILLMLGFCVLAPVGDSMAKLIGDSVPLLQVVVVRFGLQAVLLTPFVLAAPPTRLSWRLTGWIALRTVLHVTALGAMFLALRFLPMAEAIAIAFVMPFLLLLLGWTLMGESVGPRRLAACAVGFAGTLLVVQPTFADVGAPALLPFVVAVGFSLFMLVTRHVSRQIDVISLQWVSGGMATLALAPLLAVGAALDVPVFGAVMPSSGQWWLLLGIGTFGTLAHLLMTWSLRFAPSATLAPMQYLEIPVATALGWLIFGELPNGVAAVGIAITITSGLYVIWREQQASRHPGPRPVPPVA